MNLIDQIQNKVTLYFKSGQKEKMNHLKTLIGEIQTIASRPKGDSSDDTVIKTIKKFINDAKSTSELSGINNDEYINTLSEFLPKQLTSDEIKQIIKDNELKDVPSAMKHFSKKYKGLYDSKKVLLLI